MCIYSYVLVYKRTHHLKVICTLLSHYKYQSYISFNFIEKLTDMMNYYHKRIRIRQARTLYKKI